MRALVGAALAQAATAAIPASERQVLINLYNSTHGGGWTSNANWCSGACPASGTPTFNSVGTECTWSGITCDDAQAHVIAVALMGNNLAGTLPALGSLTELRYFAVASNQLSGAIPALSTLTQLQTFYASANHLTGSIPSLTGMTSLGDFAVAQNQLSGSMPSLSGLTNLYSFIVSDNLLSGTMPTVSGLTNLRDFDVGGNQLAGSIPAMSGEANLLRLAFDRNTLTGSIPTLPAKLYTFSGGHNRLSGAVSAAPGTLYTPFAFAPSLLCPNPLSTTASANDAGWDAATGYAPWWATPFAGNRCDDLFHGAFD